MKKRTKLKVIGLFLSVVMLVSMLGAFALTANAGDATYAVTVDSSITHGTVTAGSTSAAEGETVTLTVTPDSGYSLALSTLTVSDGTNKIETTAGENGTFTFTMPAGNVTVSARFGIPNGELYYVNDEENGTTYIFGSGTLSASSWASILYSNVVLEEGVTAIGANAFRGISSLETLTIKGDLTSIGRNAFQGCSSLAYIYYYGTTTPSSTGNNLSGIMLYSLNGVSILGLEPINAYSVKIDSTIENGTVTVPHPIAAAGDTVKLTVIPAEGYKLDALTVSDGTDSVPTTAGHTILYTFVMPASDVTVKATFKPAIPCTTTVGCTGGYLNGFCSVCDDYQPAEQISSENYRQYGLTAETYEGYVGYYAIGNAGQLYWFAKPVNADLTNLNAILTADITVNENVLKEDGTLNGDGSEFRAWTPVGSAYNGTFDGNHHTVSGLYFNDDSVTDVGLFGRIDSNGTVKNVGIIDSFFRAYVDVGGVVGYNDGTVENCYNSGSISGVQFIGGVVGLNDGTITDCYSTGTVYGADCVGGVVGADSGTVGNCYYLTGTATGGINGVDAAGQAEAKTAEQFASGEVTYLLGEAFGQKIGTDAHPVFATNDNIVYENLLCDGSVEYSNFQSEEGLHGDLNDYGYCESCQVKITNASLSVGQDLTLKYYVGLYDSTLVGEGQTLAMQFTVKDKTITVTEYTDSDGKYVFAFRGIAPQQMTDLIDAVVVVLDSNGEVVKTLAGKEDYTVRDNALALIAAYKDLTDAKSVAMVQSVVDILYYGAAAQNYKDYNVEDLATNGLGAEFTPSAALPAEADRVTKIVQHVDTLGAVKFSGASVWFDNTNKLLVVLSSYTENTKVIVKTENDTVGKTYTNLTSTYVYTDSIYALNLGDVYTFELYEGDTHIQTLTYSAYSYVYAMMSKTEADGTTPTEMAVLAQALYRYGESAAKYYHLATGGGSHSMEPTEKSYIVACDCGYREMVIDGTLGGKAEGTEDDVVELLDMIEAGLADGVSMLVVTGENLTMIDMGDGLVIPVVAEALFRITNDMGIVVGGVIDLVLADVTTVTVRAFSGVIALSSVYMPNVTDVKTGAFAGCRYIQTMTFDCLLTGLGMDPFMDIGENVGGCDLILHKKQATAGFRPYGDDFGNQIFKSITFAE